MQDLSVPSEKSELLDSSPRERIYCLDCLRAKNACFCSQIKPLDLPFELLILMHPLEFRSKTGTGRMLALSTSPSKILVDVDFSQNEELNFYLHSEEYLPVLLYPGKGAHALDTRPWHPPKDKKVVIILIDATWACAKKMMKLSPNLQNLPRLSFENSKTSRYLFKRQPIANCLSSLESFYELCVRLQHSFNFEQPLENLLSPFEWMVRYQIDAQNDPARNLYRAKPFKGDRNELPKAKRWRHRPVFFS